MLNYYDTLVEAHQALRKQGYTTNFDFKNNRLIDLQTKKAYRAEDLLIVEYHRFEGMSNPSDSSIIVALEATDGIKGTAVSSYGNFAGTRMLEFLDKVKIKKRAKRPNGNR